MAQVTGRATIVLNGTSYQSKEGAKLDPGGLTTETVMSDQGRNRVSKLRPSKISAEFLWIKGLALKELNDFIGGTVTFQCDTGETYVAENADRVGDLEATSGSGGGVPVVFEGPEATLVTSGA